MMERQLGLWRCSSLVVGNMIGAGIFLLPASLATYGSIELFGWLVTSLGAIFLALVFARLSVKLPKTGGPYVYSRHVFGDFIGFIVAWSYWIANGIMGNAALAIASVSYLSSFWPNLAGQPTLGFLISLSAIWVLTIINAFGVRAGGAIQLGITILKILPLFIIAVVGVFYVDFNNIFPITTGNHSAFSALGGAATLTLFAFMGLESSTIPADNVINPKKTIPRSTILGTIFTAFIYMWLTIVIMGIINPQTLSHVNAPFAVAGTLILGPVFGGFIAASAVFSSFGTLNGWILLQGQVPLAAARDGLFPKVFTSISRRGVPIFGLIISSVIVTFLLALNYEAGLVEQFTFIGKLTIFAILLPYLFTGLADLVLIFREKLTLGKMIRPVLIAFIATFYSIWAITAEDYTIIALGSLFVAAGIPIYLWSRYIKT